MRSKGKIATWKDDKGFGFIAPNDGGSQVFIHIKAFSNRNRRPEVGDVVTYAVTKDQQGRTRAASATYAGEKLARKARQKLSAIGIGVATVFLAAIGASVYAGNLSPAILVVYLVVSLVTFIAYAIDKSAARKGRWRTSEGALHFLALAGGWPGALLAQQTLRHKSKKTSFLIFFWLTVVLNCAAFVWLDATDRWNQLEQLLASIVQP